MSHPSPTSLESLLEQFLQSGRSEKSFADLVQAVGGLVYGSAFRRTGDASLSEEVAQNVFTILAQKSESLRGHSSLSSWLYRTTSFEAEKVLRREIRHRRRVEKFSQEATNESNDGQVISRETLRLLDQSIDHLNSKDRALLLARFFEGKKFREIAAETKQTEAACKVRLRRVMDKMSRWLSARGCTLSVAALTSLLATEWSRACPPVLLASAPGFLPKLQVSSSPINFISQILSAMKISKMTALGITLLLGAVAVPWVLHSNHNELPPAAREPSVNVTAFANSKAVRDKDSGRSMEALFANYPYAYDRLEEIYQKYPNLRRKEFTQPDGPTLVDELNSFFKELDSKEIKLPAEIRRQLKGEDEWDSEVIAAFLSDKKALIDKLLEISKYSIQESKFFYRIDDTTMEVLNARAASKLLSLAFLQEIRLGDTSKAELIFKAELQMQKAVSRGFLVHAVVGGTLLRRLHVNLRDLAREGYDMSSFSHQMAAVSLRENIINGLRADMGGLVSLVEVGKRPENRKALINYLGPMLFHGPVKEGEKKMSIIDQAAAHQEALTLDVHEFQENYARVISDLIDAVPDPENLESMIEWKPDAAALGLDQYGFSRGRQLILERIVPQMAYQANSIIKWENSKQELITWDALNQAQASGLAPTALSDLVPEFLSVIPVDLITQEPFIYDAEARTLKTSSSQSK